MRGWVAKKVEKGGVDQRWVGRKSTSVWLSPEETTNWTRAAEAAWAAQGEDPAAAARAKSLADREKAVSAAASWMDQIEEQARDAVKVMRPEKIDKMRRDRKGMWAKLGGILRSNVGSDSYNGAAGYGSTTDRQGHRPVIS